MIPSLISSPDPATGLPRRLAFIDVETTGAHIVHDRVTEIAILRVEDGQVVERWQSLVNPEQPIPGMIQDLIGITSAMVADAPRFAELADTVQTLLADCVFVAHNARFDYGFIKHELKRAGREFDAPVLCTVKLSRALHPEHHRHGLDALIERHGLHCAARHRAMGDAEVLWQFVRLIQDRFAPEVLARAAARASKAAPLPPGLPEGMLEALPDAPGVYLFYARPEAGVRKERPLYLARSAALRARVREHLAVRGGKDAELARQVCRVEWIETAGEFGAMLLEAELLKTLSPVHNRGVQGGEAAFALRLIPGRRRAPIYEHVPIAGTDPHTWQGLYGVFRNRREAENLLREMALLYSLCLRRLGLEPGTAGSCSAFAARRCAGVCAGRETAAEHDARLAAALAAAQLRTWPWPGPVVVSEHDVASGREAHHLLDHWCHLGTVERRDDIGELRAAAVRRFDLDVWRLLVRWFAAPARLKQAEPLSG